MISLPAFDCLCKKFHADDNSRVRDDEWNQQGGRDDDLLPLMLDRLLASPTTQPCPMIRCIHTIGGFKG